MTYSLSTLKAGFFTLTALALLLPLTACEELSAPDLASGTTLVPPGAPTSHSVESETVHLDLGASAALRGDRHITFDALGPDGRCPIDVDCVHPGKVEADFTVDMGMGPVSLTLALPGGDPRALPLHLAQRATVAGFVIYLVQVSPYPSVHGVRDISGDGEHQAAPVASVVIAPCPSGAEACGPDGDPDGDAHDS